MYIPLWVNESEFKRYSTQHDDVRETKFFRNILFYYSSIWIKIINRHDESNYPKHICHFNNYRDKLSTKSRTGVKYGKMCPTTLKRLIVGNILKTLYFPNKLKRYCSPPSFFF